MPLSKTVKVNLCLMFDKEVSAKRHKIDPEDEHDWYSLTVGWAIAHGLRPKLAHELALHILTDLG